MGKWFYYMRVSTKGQNLDRQKDSEQLSDFCKRMNIIDEEIIMLEEKASGKNFERPQYQLLKQIVSEGDKIIVSSLDRFGRNYIEGRKEFAEFISKGIKVYVLNRPMLEEMYKLNDNMSKFMVNFLVDWELMNAEEEYLRIRERQEQGIKVAKAKGKHLGRPKAEYPCNFEKVYKSWKNGNITAKKAMEELNLKRTTFYKLVKNYESSN